MTDNFFDGALGGPDVRTVTAREILDALRKNGVAKIKNYYFRYGDNGSTDAVLLDERGLPKKPIGACAMGQIAINLGFDPTKTYEASQVSGYNEEAQFLDAIVALNDTSSLTFEEIADKMADDWKEKLDLEIPVV